MTDTALVAAWQEIVTVSRALNVPSDQPPANEAELHQRLDRAEATIIETPAIGTAGILAKLQAAIWSGCETPDDNDALARGNYAYLQEAAKHWNTDRQMVLSAILCLRAEEA